MAKKSNAKKKQTDAVPTQPSMIAEETITPEASKQFTHEATAQVKGFVDGVEAQHLRPLTHELRMVDGRMQLIKRKRDGLDTMHANKMIDDAELAIARNFQMLFDIAMRPDVRSVDLNGVGGRSNVGPEEFLQIRMRARDQIDDWYAALGGRGSRGYLAMRHLIGERRTLDEMVRTYSHSHHLWRGILFQSLTTLVVYEDKSKTRATRYRAVTNMGDDNQQGTVEK